MAKIFGSYIDFLAAHPERMESIGLWTVTVAFTWAAMIFYRGRLIAGLEGKTQLFEGNEILLFILLLMVPPIISYSVFFQVDLKFYAWLFISIGILYSLLGRWIFEWILAFRSGATRVDDGSTTTVVTTAKTEIKTEQV